jgi:hypothetical protein
MLSIVYTECRVFHCYACCHYAEWDDAECHIFTILSAVMLNAMMLSDIFLLFLVPLC